MIQKINEKLMQTAIIITKGILYKKFIFLIQFSSRVVHIIPDNINKVENIINNIYLKANPLSCQVTFNSIIIKIPIAIKHNPKYF